MTFSNAGKRLTGTMTRAAGLLALAGALAACEDGGGFNFGGAGGDSAEATAQASQSTKLVERDVEAPEIFQVTDQGLWDGRPSLGGVWVAHSDVKDPERVIIRNTANGKFVIGALFRREREIPGPRFQISSDAAAALGMLAGAPQELNVTALRREEVAPEPAAEAAPEVAAAAPDEIEETTLDPVAGASAAIARAESEQSGAPAVKPPSLPAARAAKATAAAAAATAPAPAAAAPAPAAAPAVAAAPTPPAPPPAAEGRDLKAYLQVGIFSVERNAENTAKAMRAAGMVPTIRKQSTKGKDFWRVLVGPANSAAEREALLKQIKAAGFTDSYAVDN